MRSVNDFIYPLGSPQNLSLAQMRSFKTALINDLGQPPLFIDPNNPSDGARLKVLRTIDGKEQLQDMTPDIWNNASMVANLGIQGRLLAYGLGSDKPRQLLLRHLGRSSEVELVLGEELSAAKLMTKAEVTQAPKRPDYYWLKRFVSLFSSAFDQELNHYHENLPKFERFDSLCTALNHHASVRQGAIAGEQAILNEKQMMEAYRVNKEDAQTVLTQKAKTDAELERIGTFQKNLQGLLGHKGENRINDCTNLIDEQLVNAALLDRNTIDLPDNANGLRPEHFAALALVVCGCPYNEATGSLDVSSYDPMQYQRISGNLARNRELSDDQINIINHARSQTAELLQDPQLLGSMINAALLQNDALMRSQSHINSRYQKHCLHTELLVQAIDQIPGLKEQMEAQYPDTMKNARGSAAIGKIYREGLLAQSELLDAPKSISRDALTGLSNKILAKQFVDTEVLSQGMENQKLGLGAIPKHPPVHSYLKEDPVTGKENLLRSMDDYSLKFVNAAVTDENPMTLYKELCVNRMSAQTIQSIFDDPVQRALQGQKLSNDNPEDPNLSNPSLNSKDNVIQPFV